MVLNFKYKNLELVFGRNTAKPAVDSESAIGGERSAEVSKVTGHIYGVKKGGIKEKKLGELVISLVMMESTMQSKWKLWRASLLREYRFSLDSTRRKKVEVSRWLSQIWQEGH